MANKIILQYDKTLDGQQILQWDNAFTALRLILDCAKVERKVVTLDTIKMILKDYKLTHFFDLD